MSGERFLPTVPLTTDRPVTASIQGFRGYLDPALELYAKVSSGPSSRSVSPGDAAMSSVRSSDEHPTSPRWTLDASHQTTGISPPSPFDGIALPDLFGGDPIALSTDPSYEPERNDPGQIERDQARRAFERGFEVQVDFRDPTSELSSPTEVTHKGAGNDSTSIQATSMLGHGDIPAPARPKKSHARKQPPGHIPRPRNAFILFRKHITDNNLIPTTVEVKHQNISIVASKMWSEAPPEVKAEFSEAARIEKDEHARLYPNYRYQPAYRRTDIVRRRVRKDPNEDQKCDAVANLLIQGKAGDILEDEIKEQIASVSPEVAGPSAVKLVVKRGRRRRKETPGELSKGAIRAQAAQARARAMRESWAESGFLIASSGHASMEPKNRYDLQQAQRYGQEQRLTRSMHAGRQAAAQGVQLERPNFPNDMPSFEQARYEPYQHVPSGAMSNDGEQSWPPSPLDPFSQQNRYVGHQGHQRTRYNVEAGGYQGGPAYPPEDYGPERSQPPSPFENDPNVAFHYQGARAPEALYVPQGAYPGPVQPFFMQQAYPNDRPQDLYSRYNDPYHQQFPLQPRLEAWHSPSQAQFPAAAWEQLSTSGPGHGGTVPFSPITPTGEAVRPQFPVDYAPVARPADIIAGHWNRDRGDGVDPNVGLHDFLGAASAPPAEGIAPEDISALIPFIEPRQVSEDAYGNPSHGIDFGHQGELFGGELMQDKDVDLQGYEDALRHNHDPMLLRM